MKKKPFNAPELPVGIYVLLDRSGSMSDKWKETLASINSYAAGLAKEIKANITLAVFDANGRLEFDVIRRLASATGWKKVGHDEVHPRGSTPLFDAIARISVLAEADNHEKTILTIMTDGHENASTDTTRDRAKEALDRLRSRGWQVIFMGADFDAFPQAHQLGIMRGQTMSMQPQFLASGIASHTTNTVGYATGATAAMDWTATQRAAANENKVAGKRAV